MTCPCATHVRCWAVLAALAAGAVPAPALAAGTAAAPEFVGVLALAVETDVGDQLGLTQDQKQKLLDLVEAREAEALELAIQLKSLPPAERTAKLAPFRQQSEERGLAILSKQQRARLQQIRLARWGLAGAVDGEMAERLKLSPQQQNQIADLVREQAERLSRADEKTAQTVRAETDRKVSSLLEPEQRNTLQALVAAGPGAPPSAGTAAKTKASGRGESAQAGPPSPEPEKADKLSPGPAGAAGDSAPSPEPAKATASETAGKGAPSQQPAKPTSPEAANKAAAPKGAAPPPSALVANDAGAEPTEEEVQAWEDILDKLSAEPGPRVAEATDRLLPAKSSDRLRFNFRYQPWKDVLDWFAESADLSLVGDNIPKGTFNYSDTREYTAAEAIDLLNSVLLTKGYTLIRRERMLMIINLEDGIPPNLVKNVSQEDLDKRGEFELVEVLFQLQNVSPEEAEQEIRKLMGPQGSVNILPKSRQILVRETAGRLRVIRQAIQAIENPQGAAARIRAIEVKYADPQDVLAVLRQLLDISADRGTAADGSVHVILDPSGGRLLVTGKPDAVARVEEVVKTLDVPDPANPQKTRLGDPPQLEVYTVTGADPNSVLQVLQTLLAGMPEVRLSVDPKTGNLIALGRRSAHATIKATLEQLQRDARRLEVFQLRTLDPQLAVAAITKLFANDAGPGAPKVDGDPYSKQLLVRGSEPQIQQIRGMLQQMGESVAGDGKIGGSTVRVLPLTGRAARSALEGLQEVWPSVRENRIRVVTPSAGGISTHRPSASPEGSSENGAGVDRPPYSGGERRSSNSLLEQFRRAIQAPVEAPAAPRGSERPAAPPSSNPPPPQTPAVPSPKGGTQPQRGPADKSASSTDGIGGLRPKVVFAAQVVAAEGARSPAEAAQPKSPATPAQPKSVTSEPLKAAAAPAPSKPAPAEAAKPAPPTGAGQDKRPAEIVVRPGPGGLVIASKDVEALNEIEQLLGTLAGNFLSGKPEFTVFYLKHAKASAVEETLEQILGGGTTSSTGGSQSLISDLAGAALGDVGGGLLGTLLGGTDGGAKATGPIQITADNRLNALFVRAKPTDLDTIEDLLKILDERESPEEILASPKPRMIPVYNTQAEEVANVVRQVYQERLAGAAGANRPPTPQDFIMAMRNMRGGGGGSRRGAPEEPTKMSIGVDARTNSLVVAAPDALFQEVKELVEQLDDAAVDASQTLEVVSLQRTSSEAVRQALTALVGSSVQFGRTSTGSSTPQTTPGQFPQFGGFGSRRAFGSPFGFPGMMGGPMGGGFPGGGGPFPSPFMGPPGGGGFPGGGGPFSPGFTPGSGPSGGATPFYGGAMRRFGGQDGGGSQQGYRGSGSRRGGGSRSRSGG